MVKTTALNTSKPHCVWTDFCCPRYAMGVELPWLREPLGRQSVSSLLLALLYWDDSPERLSQMYPQDDGTFLERA